MTRVSSVASATLPLRALLPLLLVLLVLVLSVRADQKEKRRLTSTEEDTLIWSAERCEELGYGGMFDYCAELEFCRGEQQQQLDRRRRLLGDLENDEFDDDDDDGHHPGTYMRHEVQRVDSGDLVEEILVKELNVLDDDFDDDDDDDDDNNDNDNDEHNYYRHVLRRADFGWRVPGSPYCSWPGPTIRLARGRSYGLVVCNTVNDDDDTTTTLYAHGLHVASHGNANDATRSIQPGDALLYNYTIPPHHMGGTFWYYANAHVAAGAFGALVVEDGTDVGPPDAGVLEFLRHEHERTLVLSNHDQHNYNGAWVGTTIPFDQDDVLHLDYDQWYRLRVIGVHVVDNDPSHARRDSSFKMTVDGCDVRPIAHDGVWRFEVPGPERKTHVLSLSSRVDLAVRCGDGPSTGVRIDGRRVAMLRSTGIKGDPNVSPFVVNEKDGTVATTWSSKRPPYLADLRHQDQSDHQWKVSTDKMNGSDPLSRPLCDQGNRNFRYDSLEEWTVDTSSQQQHHPLHVHGHHVQIVDEVCGGGHDHGEYYDTVDVDGPCRVRLRLVDVAGRTTLGLARTGNTDAMAYVNVVGGPKQPDEPRVHECADGKRNCDPPVEAELCEGEYEEEKEDFV